MEQVNKVTLSTGKVICDNDFAHYRVEKLVWEMKFEEGADLVIPRVNFWMTNTLILYFFNDNPFVLLTITRIGNIQNIIESRKLNVEHFKQRPFYDTKTGLYNQQLITDFIIKLLRDSNLSSIKEDKVYPPDLDRFYLL